MIKDAYDDMVTPRLTCSSVWIKVVMPTRLYDSQATSGPGMGVGVNDVNITGISRVQSQVNVLVLIQRASRVQPCDPVQFVACITCGRVWVLCQVQPCISCNLSPQTKPDNVRASCSIQLLN